MKSECEGISKEELKLSNGCGSSFWLAYVFRIPKWLSHAFFCCCSTHDILYQLGKTIKEKHVADDTLYDCMMYSAFHSPPHQKKLKILLAELVYWALSTKLSDIAYQKAKPLKFYFK